MQFTNLIAEGRDQLILGLCVAVIQIAHQIQKTLRPWVTPKKVTRVMANDRCIVSHVALQV